MPVNNSFKLALICGGPSLERGISLNSARSVMDHLQSAQLTIIPLYVDRLKQFYPLSAAQLYSNTTEDFDFKLQQMAIPLNLSDLTQLLQSVDLVFPLIHGAFGEDGELQALLEKLSIPFVGPSSACCKGMFCKNKLSRILSQQGYPTFPQLVLNNQLSLEKQDLLIHQFFQEQALKRVIVKPAIGGSSIGVSMVHTPQEALKTVQELLKQNKTQQILLEPFCKGQEFTIVVFENSQGVPVALMPTEVELKRGDILDFRKKYLPNNDVTYHTPPRLEINLIQKMRQQAVALFKLFGMRDFVRLDGWILPNQTLYFTDINPISGLEQNSFLFQQAAVIGMSHRQALECILQKACQRYDLSYIPQQVAEEKVKDPVYILFGGSNAERQVSLMSGTNVWLKLLQSSLYTPFPFFVDSTGSLWELPYRYMLNHTVEEIQASCLSASETQPEMQILIQSIREELGLVPQEGDVPQRYYKEQFLQKAQSQKAFVFIAMHGGEGEDGTWQQQLERYDIPFNGSQARSSARCMDKFETGETIDQLQEKDLFSLPKKSVYLASQQEKNEEQLQQLWEQWCDELEASRLIIKPRSDGCSAGIVLLHSAVDLKRYIDLQALGIASIPAHTFQNQLNPIEMPSAQTKEFILEPYIETDLIQIRMQTLQHISKQGWIELTVGVMEEEGNYHAFNPSITIAEGAVLSLEEKFQGGTGVNLTPPPENLFSPFAVEKIKRLIEKAAAALEIQNYARLDIFFNRLTEKMILIEANTLPGLTPSTVIYHQALAEKPPLSPLNFLEKIITSKLTANALR